MKHSPLDKTKKDYDKSAYPTAPMPRNLKGEAMQGYKKAGQMYRPNLGAYGGGAGKGSSSQQTDVGAMKYKKRTPGHGARY